METKPLYRKNDFAIYERSFDFAIYYKCCFLMAFSNTERALKAIKENKDDLIKIYTTKTTPQTAIIQAA